MIRAPLRLVFDMRSKAASNCSFCQDFLKTTTMMLEFTHQKYVTEAVHPSWHYNPWNFTNSSTEPAQTPRSWSGGIEQECRESRYPFARSRDAFEGLRVAEAREIDGGAGHFFLLRFVGAGMGSSSHSSLIRR